MDISLRLNKEMLVLGGPLEAGLQRLGIDVERDLAVANLFEPETIKNALSAYVLAGAQCLVANTKNVIQAKLAHENFDDRIEEVAKASLEIAKSCKAQHVIVELSDCMLPLDDTSRNSLIEFKNQYVSAGRVFENIAKNKELNFDAYMISDMDNISKIKCALMGLKQVSDKPIFVCVEVDAKGMLNSSEAIYDYAAMLQEFGATVAGIKVKDDLSVVEKLIKRLRAGCDLPLLVDFDVEENGPYHHPDFMKDAALMANKCGAQFLRASGIAKPAHAAVLAGITQQVPLNLKIGV